VTEDHFVLSPEELKTIIKKAEDSKTLEIIEQLQKEIDKKSPPFAPEHFLLISVLGAVITRLRGGIDNG
jgi:hypothetical protein